ncbi:hypothetical protein N7448_007985 [Penicillium atrosanguineum]|uniref:Uncharacterized protein n=1 Tax=Penicillium atrosanguineum TaxID=1132637 RepID=A0A9W9GQP9_9EURO|nr:60S ribosomal protein L6 [Penicillium atrosanguineum]KAJ5127206.1 hypothetical protein N7448_007985 [Penicillium atrosanguineum]KAJ5147412.1 hypothetical protein N7526_000764 [Penicillium atrosanguineum]KAJ5314110.1 60S ribosomal protein L6 [Penicillium atrosanguineum]KAJ5331275.1 hypothetical protein N7476_001058 [Penicillium atrosanguineum]
MYHQLPSHFSPSRASNLPSDTSSPSSRTTSPPSSPTSSKRSPYHLFNLSFYPHSHKSETDETHLAGSTQCGHSILPCAVLRGRSSLMVLRRRPSAVDMALNEERSRCDGDAIERAGLDLMEPRPVDMKGDVPTFQALGPTQRPRSIGAESRDSRSMPVQQPRFVMGGIFEVMEGRA